MLLAVPYRELGGSVHSPEGTAAERPKAGFGIPVGEWIKGLLRPWAEDLLDPNMMRAQGFFDPDIVQRRWREHLAGSRDSTPAIWAILMFQSWLQANCGTNAPAELPPAAMAI